jgi:hypothetical protein
MEGIWKEVVVAKLQVLFLYLPGGTEQIVRSVGVQAEIPNRGVQKGHFRQWIITQAWTQGHQLRCGSYIFSYWNSDIIVLGIINSASVGWKLSFDA